MCDYHKKMYNSIQSKSWKKEKDDSKLIRYFINGKRYEDAINIIKKHQNNFLIQSQLITIYIEKKDYEKAIDIARRFPGDKIIQSQLMTIYIEEKKYKKAIDIAKRFPYYAQIQSQLNILTNDEDKAVIIDKDLFKMDTVLSEELKFPKEIFEIRSKISLGNISTNDLSTLESLKEQIDYEKYLLIKLAIYEKLNLSNMGIKLLKQDTSLDDRLRKQLVMQFERKNKIYNLEKWDDLIGWFNDLNFDVLTNDCLQDSDIKMVTDDLLPKNDSNVHQIKNNSKSKIKKGTKSNGKVIEIPSSKTNLEKTKKKTIKESKNKTLDDMLNQVYKEIVLKLKIKYYIEMHDEKTKKSAMYKYDRLEEVLAGDANIRNFELLLLMIIGDGEDNLSIEQSVPDKYNDEYTKVLRKINSRSHRKY